MAKSIKIDGPGKIQIQIAIGSGYSIGDPIAVGGIVGVVNSARDTNGFASVIVGGMVATMSVEAIDGSGNAAVAVGDEIKVDPNGANAKLNKKTQSGSPLVTLQTFGWALATITAGTVKTIDILVVP